MRNEKCLRQGGGPGPPFSVHTLFPALSVGLEFAAVWQRGGHLQITRACDPFFSHLENIRCKAQDIQQYGPSQLVPYLNDRTTSSQEAPFQETPFIHVKLQPRLQLIYLGLSCSLTRLLAVARQL